MVFWQSHICFVLLLAFSGLNLISSDCSTDVHRSNDASGFCDNRNLRRTGDIDYNKNLLRRARDFGERIDERAELRESENRRGYDELRRNSDFERRNHQDDERRQRIERDERHIERLNRRQDERDHIVARQRDERGSLRSNDNGRVRNERRSQDRRMIRREIDDAGLRLNKRQAFDALRRNERFEMDRRVSGDRRSDVSDRMQPQRRFDASEREREVRRRESDSVRRFDGERRREIRDTNEAERVESVRRDGSQEERDLSRRNQERRMENERRETKRFIGMDARQNDQRRDTPDTLVRISRQQVDDVLMPAKEFNPIVSGLAWLLLELTLLGAIIAHIIKKDDTIKSKSFGDHVKGFFSINSPKSIKAL